MKDLKVLDGELFLKVCNHVNENLGKPFAVPKLKPFQIGKGPVMEFNMANPFVRQDMHIRTLMEDFLGDVDFETSFSFSYRYRILFPFARKHKDWLKKRDLVVLNEEGEVSMLSYFLIHILGEVQISKKGSIKLSEVEKKFKLGKDDWDLSPPPVMQ